jgi:hypothetical protein
MGKPLFARSVVKPDPVSGSLSGSGSRRAKMTHKNRKKVTKVTSTGCSLRSAEGFSCSFDVLYEGLGISKLQFLIKKDKTFVFFLNFWSSKHWIRIGSESGSTTLFARMSKVSLDICTKIKVIFGNKLEKHTTWCEGSFRTEKYERSHGEDFPWDPTRWSGNSSGRGTSGTGP